MKKTVFRKLNFLIAIGGIFAALALGGCENLLSSTSSSDDSAPVNFIPPAGNVENGYGIIHGILPQETSASTRSAIPDVPTISSYKVFAQNGITTIEANVDNASKTFSISLPYGTWNITANGLLTNGRVVYTQTQKNIAVSAANPTVELKFNLSYSTNPEDGEGTISLTVKFPASGAASTIAGIECTLTKGGSKITVPVSQADLQAGTFKIEHITEDLGTYSLTIQCYGNSDNLVYRIDEIVNVYANLTTDKFVGSAPYISAGEINITQAMLDEFQQTTLYVNATSGDDNNTGTQFDPLRTFNRAVELVNNSTRPPATEFRIFLQSDVVDGAELELNAGKKLTVASAGNTSTITSLGRAFTVAATSELTVQSVQFQKLRFVVEGTFAMNEGKISGNELDGNGGAIYIKAGGQATITGGEISNNKATLSGGGIYNEGGTLEISGGTKIIDCTSGSIGGGIYNDDASATATITDCDITGCTSTTGGGSIGNAYGTLTVTGGSIERSSARVGGGIWNASNGTLIIDGTTITDCEAKHQGGGIYTSGNSPNKIKDCIITSCTVSETARGNGGGGIYIYKNGMLEMTGGRIEGCTAPHNGGGIYNAGGTVGAPVAITGVTIIGGGDIDNLDANNGGGIYNTENGTLTIDGGTTIADCTSGVGGGIYNTDGSTLTVNSTTITGCKSKSGGGGIYNGGSSSTVSVATVTDCTIESCTTRNMNGGGICNGGTLTVTGGSISNSSASLGGGISLGGTFTISGVTIENCTARGWGGGIYTSGYDESSKIENCTINGCSVTGKNLDGSSTSDNGGGGIANNSGGKTLTVIGGQITGCRAATYGGGIYIVTGNLAISDLTITGGGNVNELDALHGGGISAYYRSSLTMTDCEIKNCTARNGGAIAGADTLTMDGGTISGNTATQNGGGISVSGTLTMKAGTTISGNTATKSGGGVYVSSGTLAMDGGTISDNIANESGGGVYVYNGTFTMNDGTISGNISRGTTEGSFGGGGIHIYHSTASANGGVFTMTGGTVSGNEAVYGGGIWGSNFSEISLEGGTFSGNTAATSGQGAYVSPGCTFKMSGAASLVSNNGDNDVYLHGVKNSSTGAVMSYATICVAGALTATSPVATITPAIYEADQAVLSADTGLTITPTICSSFAMSSAPAGMAELGIAPDGTGTKGILKYSTFYVRGTGAGWYAENPGYTAAVGNDTTGDGSKAKPFATIQKAIETAFAMNDGASEYTIYVDGTITGGATATANGMGDITPTKALNLKIQSMSETTNATLDAQNNGRALYIGANAAVTLKNVNIANGSVVSDAGGGILNLGALTITGGTIENCTANLGGGIFSNVTDTSVTSTITDCTITGCTTNETGNGGGIYNLSGTLTLSGVTITGGNNADSPDTSNGGGIYNSSGTLTIEGNSTISNFVVRYDGGGIYNAGTLTMTGGSITDCGAQGTGDTDGGGGIYNASGALTLSGVDITFKSNAISAARYGGGIYNAGTLTMTDGSITGRGSVYGKNINQGGGIYNTGALAVEGVTISDFYTINYGGGIYNNNGETAADFVTYKDCTITNCVSSQCGGAICAYKGKLKLENVDITGGAEESNGIYCNGSELTIIGGKIEGFHDNNYSAIMNSSSKKFTMDGTTISGNSNKESGGGVRISSCPFEIKNCIISGNSVKDWPNHEDGGGIHIWGAVGTITNTTISGNTATEEGGGIWIGGDADVTITDCTIKDNTVETDGIGCGVYVGDPATCTINGNTIISGNTADKGGGVYIYEKGTLTMNGGTISGNTADKGGGVYAYKSRTDVNGGTFIMKGGSVSGNTAASDGGGVYVDDGGTFTMEGGTIGGAADGNTAAYGGGVYVYRERAEFSGGIFTMKGGTISDNTATGKDDSGGGGIHLYGGTLIMEGGTISGNTATGTTDDSGGGGIYVYGDANYTYAGRGTLTMTGGTISGNVAHKGVGAFIDKGSTFTMGGAANFVNDNDIYLHDNTSVARTMPTIQIASALTATTPVATITLPDANWTVGRQVLLLAADSTTTLADEREKFALSEAGWEISTSGKLLLKDIYVASTGNDTTGNGTQARPLATLQKAFDQIKNNDESSASYTIHISGTVAGNSELEEDVKAAKILITGEVGADTDILNGDGTTNVLAIYCAAPVEIKNVKITGGTVGIKVGDHWKSKSPSVTFGEGAIVSGNSGRGVVVYAHFRMTDGSEISYNMGGGVTVYDQITSFIMKGGTISHNTAENGGGIYIDSVNSTININGGSITENTASQDGGGIYSYEGICTMNGGSITNNTAREGGGFYVRRDKFIMNGGVISGNSSYGGYVGSFGEFVHNGGTMSDSVYD